MLPLQIVLHYEVKMNQNIAKESLLGVSRRVLTCILTLKLRKTHIGVFREDFSYSCFFISFCCFQKLRLSSLDSVLHLLGRKPVQRNCLQLFKIIKLTARSKGKNKHRLPTAFTFFLLVQRLLRRLALTFCCVIIKFLFDDQEKQVNPLTPRVH